MAVATRFVGNKHRIMAKINKIFAKLMSWMTNREQEITTILHKILTKIKSRFKGKFLAKNISPGLL